MRKIAFACSAILLVPAAAALAQAANGAGPCVSPETNATRVNAAQCPAAYRNQGLRGDDRVNHTAVCVAQARLTCLQQAAAQHVTTVARVQYMNSSLTT